MPKHKLTAGDCPDHLDDAAKKEWKRMVAALALQKSDRGLLAGYCSAWSQHRRAESELAKTGPVIKAPTGQAVENPWAAINRRATECMRKCLTTLHARAKALAQHDEDRAFDLD
jgi:P27 family predicted phage terminase small subunit